MEPITNDKQVKESVSKEFIKEEIDLHIAEYNALTSRATYFINIQFVLLTALIAWVIVIGNIWNTKIEYLLNWGLLIGAQIIGIVNANMEWETYSIVRYIERDLKPRICNLLSKDTFWDYESYLIIQRGQKFNSAWSIFTGYFWILLAIATIICTIIYRFHNWLIWDWVGVVLNLLLFIVMTVRTDQTVKLRRNSWK